MILPVSNLSPVFFFFSFFISFFLSLKSHGPCGGRLSVVGLSDSDFSAGAGVDDDAAGGAPLRGGGCDATGLVPICWADTV